jgi:hypothetical protein
MVKTMGLPENQNAQSVNQMMRLAAKKEIKKQNKQRIS